jgi:hypothetical protein
MRKLIFITVVCAFLAVPAMADLLTTQIKVTDGPGYGNGGAFWVEVLQGSVWKFGKGDKFLTFCVENDEYFYPGSSYWVKIDTAAVKGGSGGPEPDPLDPVTAALYQKWLASEDMTNADTATKYQLAIWKVEQEAVYDSITHNQWEDGKGNALDIAYSAYTEAVIDTLIGTVGSPSGIGGVRVMTLWANNDATGYQQDLLVVPVPAAVLLGILGLGFAGLKLRKFA